MPWIMWCRKNVWIFVFFVCLLWICSFVGLWRGLIINRPNWLPEVLKLIHRFLLKYLNLLWLWEVFISKSNLEFWSLFFSSFFKIVFWSNYSSVFVNTGHKLFAASHKLTLVTVWASDFRFSSFLLLLLQDFIKYFMKFLYICTL